MAVEGIKEVGREFQMHAFFDRKDLIDRDVFRGITAPSKVGENDDIPQSEWRGCRESMNVEIGRLPTDVVATTDPGPKGLSSNPQRLNISDTGNACFSSY